MRDPNVMRALPRQARDVLVLGFALWLCLWMPLSHAGTVAYWRFEAANPAADASGNGNDLTINGITASSDVASNAPGTQSALFDGASYAQTVAPLALSAYTSLTVEFFAKFNSSTLDMFFAHNDPNANPGAFYLDINEAADQVKLSQSTAAGWKTRTGPYPKDGAWHHYAVTLDGDGAAPVVKLYVDGVQTDTGGTTGGNQPFRDDPFTIGAFPNLAYFFHGQMDEMRVSSRVLPPSGFLIAPPLVNGAIVITQQPTNTTALESQAALFAVAATLTNGDPALLEFQWQRAGVDVPGATQSSYTLPLASKADNGVQFRVVISTPSISGVAPVTSSAATLTVINDTVAPQALSTFALVSTFVGVRFSEIMDPNSANDPSKYGLDQSGATVDSAQLQADGQTVMLGVSGLTAAQYQLTCKGISDLAGNTATNSVTGENAGLSFLDVGTVNLPATLFYSDPSQYTVSAGGFDIGFHNGLEDGLNFIYRSFTGDFDLRVQMEDMRNINGSSRGGVMVREDLSEFSRNVAALTYGPAGDNHWVTTARVDPGGGTIIPGYPASGYELREPGFAFPNAWLRITRLGEVLTSFHSTNGVNWVQLGAAVVPSPAFANEVFVGIASSAITVQGNHLVDFQYSNFRVAAPLSPTNALIVIDRQPASLSVLQGRSATFSVLAGITNGDPALLQFQWLAGGVAIPGATTSRYTIPSVTLTDSGTQYRVQLSAPGLASVTSSPATLTVQPDTAAPQASSTFALVPTMVGVSFNEALDPNTANNPAAYILDQPGASVDAALLQEDGMSVMLSVTGLTNRQYTVTYSGLADVIGNVGNGSISGTNAGLSFLDIGRVDLAGSLSATTPDRYTVNAGGYDVGFALGGADGMNYIYQAVSGDFDARVRLLDITNANVSSTGGLMVRESVAEDSRNVAAWTYGPTSDNHWVATVRMETAGATTIPGYPDAGYDLREPDFAFPNAWLRITRVGQTFACYHSTNGVDWVQLGTSVTPGTPYPDEVQIGMASSAKTIQGNHLVTVVYSEFTVNEYVTPRPALQIRAEGTSLVITWPGAATGFQLEQTATLGSGWGNVTQTPVSVAGQWQVTVPIEGSVKFFRLIQ